MTDQPVWCIMPVLAGQAMTESAISDLLGQTVPTRILVVNQGAPNDLRLRLERLAEEYPDRIFVWSHDPPLPSLAATWNRALDFVWDQSTEEPEEWRAFVVNNDVRLHPETVRILCTVLASTESLFVSALGVRQEDWFPDVIWALAHQWLDHPVANAEVGHGGPDFSCFLMSYACHVRFRFDEAFTPAFCEDLDYHRRLMLAGEADRIFGINFPYLHLASQTLAQVSPDKRAQIQAAIERGARAHYQRKWGGPVNQETFWSPFHADISTRSGDEITFIESLKLHTGPETPNLQDYFRQRRAASQATVKPIEDLCREMLAKNEPFLEEVARRSNWQDVISQPPVQDGEE